MGEPKRGFAGWRLTHRQARTAVWVAEAKAAPVVEYSRVGLLASVGRDPLTISLQEKYLLPLDEASIGGDVLRATLRSYFRANKNSSSAASALGISRQTVTNRIRTTEKLVGESIDECADPLSAALSLEELGRIPLPPDSLP
jgi:DNA-binding PucR family transcriptional regulator